MELSGVHTSELNGSRISQEHIAARGYRTLYGTDDDRHGLKEIRIPRWAWREDSAYPGLLIPMYRVTGERIGYQWKPSVPQEAPGGKREKYASQSGTPNRLDVPPLCSDAVRDPSNPLWITEGVKKADCLASRGKAVITLTGVFNWRSKMGTLGDWEDIPLQGRAVVVCFDADARDKRPVMLAMRRLGKWLESKGVATVHYLIVPASVTQEDGSEVRVKGVDDYFAAGGTLEDLGTASSRELPVDGARDAAFSDAVLADTVCSEELDGRFRWAAGLGWMTWTGKIWETATDATVTEAVRLWVLEQFNRVLDQQRADSNRDMSSQIDGWRSVLSAGRMSSLVKLAKGILECKPDDFDADRDLINCPNGILDLRTGQLQPHDPDQLMTKITNAEYSKGATHPDWDTALTALPEDVCSWFQLRAGQAITGHMTPDDLAIICQGGGANGKSTVYDGMATAAGKYHVVVSDRAMLGGASDNHPTEMMDFMGARYAVLEETPESRRLDTNRLKKLTGTQEISARRIRQDSVTFEATHSLFVNTNYRPVVDETDHGTWRRLALVRFPYTFRRSQQEVRGPMDRLGDPTLRQRVKADPQCQEAVLAWMVEGARRWYELSMIMPDHPERIQADTLAWRRESDPILSYIQDHIVFDLDRHILATELRDSFNHFLREKGLKDWGDKTFASRFGGHDLCAQNNVEKGRTRSRKGLSTAQSEGVIPAVYYAWMGVRFQTPEEGGSEPPGGENPFGGGPEPENPDDHGFEKDQVNQGESESVPGVPSECITGIFLGSRGVNFSDGTPGTGQSDDKQNEDPGDGETMIEFDPETLVDPFAEDGPGPDPFLSEPDKEVAAPSPVGDLESFDPSGEVGFDLETADADTLFVYGPGFVRIGGLINASGETATSSDIPALVAKLEAADRVYGHNILGFDGLSLAHYHGLDWEAFCAKATDTDPRSRQAHPPRSRGKSSIDDYDLDHVAKRYDVGGKTDDIKVLARKHGGFDKIPLDDAEYHSYLEGDLLASKAVHEILPSGGAYIAREHKILSAMGRMTLNGFRVDVPLLHQRYEEGQERKREAAQKLSDVHGLPLGKTVMRGRGENKREVFEPAKSPLATKEGIEWLKNLWKTYGVHTPPRTDTGRLATGAEVLDKISEHPKCPPELAEVLGLMRIITTTRTVYQTALTYLTPEGRVHPVVSMRQASGRGSVTKPGMTVFGKRDGKHVERDIFIADEGHVVFTCDLSQVDMRGVAALCQDPLYMAMFEVGKDMHTEVAAMMGVSRDAAKPLNHGYNYGMGAKAMINDGHDPALVARFFEVMSQFVIKDSWTAQVRETGERGELLDNGFGRLMRCDPHWAYTVAPALMGQGSARDITMEVLLRLLEAHPEYRPYLRTWVHDEIVFSVPEDIAEAVAADVKEAFTWEWRRVPILCDLSKFGPSWGSVSAK